MKNQWLQLPSLLLNDIIYPEVEHPWGIIAVSGAAGTGKTMWMTHYAEYFCHKLYPEIDLNIFTNFDYKNQTAPITCVDDILDLPRDSIAIIDEAPNWFDAHKWADMPPEMMQPLTQHRHADIQLIFSAQVFKHMNPRIRELVTSIVEVKTWKKRITSCQWYTPDDYVLVAGTEDEYKKEHAYRHYSFVQTPELRDLYDTKHAYIRQLLKEQNESYKLNNNLRQCITQ